MKKQFIKIAIIVGIVMFTSSAFACTTVILSGKVTKDGRPLMWKNTDTENLNHSLIYSDSKGYPLIGIARSSAKDADKAAIWTGTNSKGFSIMNTMSYNLTEANVASRNGALMRQALEVCSNVPDFKKFLDTLKRPMNVEANFGVIDAEGNAAYFETYTNGYHMVDVNDPAVAPEGYLVYTNFSYTGFYEKGAGYVRYYSAQRQVAKGLPSKAFTPQWIYTNLVRCYYNSLMDVDFTSAKALDLFNSYIPDRDFIPRRSTANSIVVHGVKKGENPELTTMWCALGFPPCTVALPSWVKLGKENSSLLVRTDTTGTSKICNMALALKATVFNVQRGNGQEYLDFSKLYNKQNTGYIQQLRPIEDHVFTDVNVVLKKWREKGSLDVMEAKALNKSVATYVENAWTGLIVK
ncbi:hypothetical protein FACS1894201_09760 [Bacteroidia bacterium]|nr:hypothetical protein FACS1894201_09760 [Bacteroidia bacterium]